MYPIVTSTTLNQQICQCCGKDISMDYNKYWILYTQVCFNCYLKHKDD
jgi:hypothetical protein